MSLIQLRDRYIPNDYDIQLDRCCKFIKGGCGRLSILKPRGWGKTRLCVELINKFDDVILVVNSVIEEMRIRRDYKLNNINKYKYNIYGYCYGLQLRGVNRNFVLLDDVDFNKLAEFKYYMGFGLTNYISINSVY